MSFPSEHSATAFTVFTSIALWNFTQIRNLEGYGSEALVVPLIMLIVPLVISLTRMSDYRHHASDIAAGIGLGTMITIFVFFFYIPRGKRLQPGRLYREISDTVEKNFLSGGRMEREGSAAHRQEPQNLGNNEQTYGGAYA